MPFFCTGDGSYAQLGDGEGDFSESSHNSNVPVEVLGGRTFSSVCTSGVHSCGLESTGKAWCWGK